MQCSRFIQKKKKPSGTTRGYPPSNLISTSPWPCRIWQLFSFIYFYDSKGYLYHKKAIIFPFDRKFWVACHPAYRDLTRLKLVSHSIKMSVSNMTNPRVQANSEAQYANQEISFPIFILKRKLTTRIQTDSYKETGKKTTTNQFNNVDISSPNSWCRL